MIFGVFSFKKTFEIIFLNIFKTKNSLKERKRGVMVMDVTENTLPPSLAILKKSSAQPLRQPQPSTAQDQQQTTSSSGPQMMVKKNVLSSLL